MIVYDRLQHEGEPRGLYIIPEQAELVRSIFERFTESGSFVAVAQDLNAQGHTTKRWQSSTGRWHGGKPFSQKSVHSILTNPVYIGKVTHTRGGVVEVFEGRHEPIMERTVWDRTQGLIETRDHTSLHRWSRPHLLTGKLRTGDGFAMSPSSVHRPLTKRGSTNQKRLVRYYVSQKAIKQGFKSCSLKAINASHLDDIVRGVVLAHVDHAPLDNQPVEIRDAWIRDIIDGCTLAPNMLVVRLVADRLTALRNHDFGPPAAESHPPTTSVYGPTITDRGGVLELLLRIQIKKFDGRRVLLAPDGSELVLPSTSQPKGHIVEAIGLAYRLHDELIRTGLSIRDYVRDRGISRSKILRLLPLTQLSPDIIRHALAGTLARSVTLDDLLGAAAQLDWEHQAKYLQVTHADLAAEAGIGRRRRR